MVGKRGIKLTGSGIFSSFLPLALDFIHGVSKSAISTESLRQTEAVIKAAAEKTTTAAAAIFL